MAALNHAKICQIYDVGPDYLVMEYIEGTQLNGPLPVDQALRYATQICDARNRGTLYYMSPEQLQTQGTGHEIGARSDIFSFGLVLYEMLTGKRAFEGSSPASVIAAIMELRRRRSSPSPARARSPAATLPCKRSR